VENIGRGQGRRMETLKVVSMSRPYLIEQRLAAFLQKRNAAFCEACLVERLLIASRAAMKAALATNCFTVRVGICPDCKARKQVIAHRAENVAA
jgi:hypothetical protein